MKRSQFPAALPAIFGNLSRGASERGEGPHQCASLGRIHRLEDAADFPATPIGHAVDQPPTRGAQVQHHRSTIVHVAPTSDETLADESITHARRRRPVDAEGLSQISGSLGTPRAEDDQRPILRK